MKKLFLLSAIFVLNCLHSQNVEVINAPIVFCPGDSIVSEFKWNRQIGITNFRIDYVTSVTGVGAHIWSVENKSFYNLPKRLVGLDTVYAIKFSTNASWQFGRVAFKTQEQNKVFFIEVNCGPVGIKEVSIISEVPIYFDLNGNRVLNPEKGVLLIKQTGAIRKKVVILD